MPAALPLLRWVLVWCLLVIGLASVPRPPAGLPAQAAAGPANTGSWQRTPAANGWNIGVQFTNYNGDQLSTAVALSQADVLQATQEFGYTKAETEALFKNCQGCSSADLTGRITDFYRRRGFQVTPTPSFLQLAIDMKELVWRNAPRMRSLALQIERMAGER